MEGTPALCEVLMGCRSRRNKKKQGTGLRCWAKSQKTNTRQKREEKKKKRFVLLLTLSRGLWMKTENEEISRFSTAVVNFWHDDDMIPPLFFCWVTLQPKRKAKRGFFLSIINLFETDDGVALQLIWDLAPLKFNYYLDINRDWVLVIIVYYSITAVVSVWNGSVVCSLFELWHIKTQRRPGWGLTLLTLDGITLPRSNQQFFYFFCFFLFFSL